MKDGMSLISQIDNREVVQLSSTGVNFPERGRQDVTGFGRLDSSSLLTLRLSSPTTAKRLTACGAGKERGDEWHSIYSMSGLRGRGGGFHGGVSGLRALLGMWGAAGEEDHPLPVMRGSLLPLLRALPGLFKFEVRRDCGTVRVWSSEQSREDPQVG
jgi:hypothetical protein